MGFDLGIYLYNHHQSRYRTFLSSQKSPWCLFVVNPPSFLTWLQTTTGVLCVLTDLF